MAPAAKKPVPAKAPSKVVAKAPARAVAVAKAPVAAPGRQEGAPVASRTPKAAP